MATYHIFTETINIPENMQKDIISTISNHAQSLLDTLKEMMDKKTYDHLDYSEESISLLDAILDQWLEDNQFSDDGMHNLIRVFRGYLAVVTYKSFAGKWWHDGNEVVYILYNGNNQTGVGLTPYSYVARRLNEGESLIEQWYDQEPLVEKIRIIR